MEFVTILRELWRRRSLVALGGLLAICIGIMTGYRVSSVPPKLESRQYHVGLASARVLIDTPDSQVIDLDPKGADALSTRANLLANLMATGPVKTVIARQAGVSVNKLNAIAPSMSADPTVTTPLTQRAAASAKSPDAYVLTIRAGETLPIIAIEAQAPTAEKAARLANAATVGLRTYLNSVAATQNIPDARRFVVTSLGPAQSADVVRGPRRLFAIVAFVLVLGFTCTAIILMSGLARGWRQAAADERAEIEPPRDDDKPLPKRRVRNFAAASRGGQDSAGSASPAAPSSLPSLAD
jgi:hypothetical protein